MGKVRFEAGVDDLLHCRFAVSPLLELMGLLCALAGIGPPAAPPALVERARPIYRKLRARNDLPALEALFTARFTPSFLAPPPRSAAQTIDDDLAEMRATPLATARAEMEFGLGARPCADRAVLDVLHSPDVIKRLAATAEECWHELMAPQWPLLKAACERDVVHRSGELSRAGWAATLAGLHPRVGWRDGGVEVAMSRGTQRIALGGKGLLFLPSVFIWPGVAVHYNDNWPKAIIYPARGLASFWESGPVTSDAALGELIGRTRARLLLALASPASTTQLAVAHRLAVGAVGDHLRVMLRASLLEAARSGRSVIYRRTSFGESVVSRTTRSE